MPMKDQCHEITCPCCGAAISVDAATGAVLAHEAPKKEQVSFEEAASAVSDGKKKAASQFSRAMEERSRQSEILEKKFRKAFEKASESDDDTPPRNPFDME